MAKVKGKALVFDGLHGLHNGRAVKGLDQPYVEVNDEKFQNWLGGDFNSGPWRTRDLTVIRQNDFARITVTDGIGGGGGIIVPAGEYYIDVKAPASNVDDHQLRLADTTDVEPFYGFGETVFLGSTELASNTAAWLDGTLPTPLAMTTATSAQTASVLAGRFEVNRETKLEIQHRCTTSKDTNGFGVGGVFDDINNLYTTVGLWQLRDRGAPFYVGQELVKVGKISNKSFQADPVVGVNQRITTSNTAPYNWRRNWVVPHAANGFTASIWVRRDNPAPTDIARYPTYFSLGRGGDFDGGAGFMREVQIAMFELYPTNTPTLRIQNEGTVEDVPGNEKVYRVRQQFARPLGTWFMFTGTWDGTNNADAVKLYMDDERDTSPIIEADEALTSTPLLDAPGAMGTLASNTHRTYGLIYSLAIWDKVLTATEIEAIYNYGNPGFLDIRNNSTGYSSAANLQYYYLPGKGQPNSDASPFLFGPGLDYGLQGENFEFEQTNKPVLVQPKIVPYKPPFG
jgi:hypothetical protein